MFPFPLSALSTEKRDVQRAGGGGRELGPHERGVLQESDGCHRGAPGGGRGGTGVRPEGAEEEGKAELNVGHTVLEERGDLPSMVLVSEVPSTELRSSSSPRPPHH